MGFEKGGRVPGGTVMVGERGPELVDLPKGSWVHPHDRTAQMLRSMPTEITPEPPGPINDPSIIEDFEPESGDAALLDRLDEQNGKLERMLRAMVAKGEVDSEDARAMREELRALRRRRAA